MFKPALTHDVAQGGEKALDSLLKSGKKRGGAYANRDAIDYLTRGLELIKTLPDSPERAQQELDLQIALGAPLAMIKGLAALEVEQTYVRARELCRQVGETAQLFPVLWGLWRFYCVRAQLQTSRELAGALLRLAPRGGEP